MFLQSRARIGGVGLATAVVAALLAMPGSASAVEAADNPDLLVVENSVGTVTRVPGDGTARSTYADGFSDVWGTALGPDGDLYVADGFGNQLIRVPADGAERVVVDDNLSGGLGVTVTANGDVYAGSYNDSMIYRYPASGGAREVFAEVGQPVFLDQDAAGNILVGDWSNGRALSITPAGVQTVLATGLTTPSSVAQRPDGSYIVVEESNEVSLVPAGGGTPTTFATVNGAYDSAIAENGDVYLSSYSSNSIVKVPAAGGAATTVATDFSNAYGLTVLDVSKPQQISFTSAAPTGATVGDTYEPVATGGASGNPVTFSTTTPDVCSYDDETGEVSFDGAGTCTVAADQAGGTVDDVEYAPAEQATQDITVGKGAQVIAFDEGAPTEGTVGGVFVPSAEGGDSGNPVTFSIAEDSAEVCRIARNAEGRPVLFTAKGTCVVNADQAGDDDYEAATTAQLSIAIDVAPTTLKLEPSDTALTATVTSSGESDAPSGQVTFTLDDQTLGTADLVQSPTNSQKAVAVLTGADPGTSGVLEATYDGDDTTLGGSTDSYVREAPRLAAFVNDAGADEPTSAEPNAAGWYGNPVFVTFTRSRGTGELLGDGPDTIERSNTARGTTFTRTVRADDGGRATVTVPLQVDSRGPVLTIRRNGTAPYARTARPIRCTAFDGRSGLDGACKVTYGAVVRGPGGGARRPWTATATDIAGNTSTRSNSFAVTGKAPARAARTGSIG